VSGLASPRGLSYKSNVTQPERATTRRAQLPHAAPAAPTATKTLVPRGPPKAKRVSPAGSVRATATDKAE
jgi:hypothetical protein